MPEYRRRLLEVIEAHRVTALVQCIDERSGCIRVLDVSGFSDLDQQATGRDGSGVEQVEAALGETSVGQ